MPRTRVKICGLQEPSAVTAAIAAGADALGFVFYADSARAITPAQLVAFQYDWPAFVMRVGLLVNPSVQAVERVLATQQIDVLQFHGNESADFCAQFGLPYIKALRPIANTPWLSTLETYESAQAILLDAGSDQAWGGTGRCFDWSLWPDPSSKPLILAGGLTPQNVRDAIRQLQPYAVDVSGGVESRVAVKCAAKIRQFLHEVQCADRIN